jgi:tetratricopeptide (TPR) repeat protein
MAVASRKRAQTEQSAINSSYRKSRAGNSTGIVAINQDLGNPAVAPGWKQAARISVLLALVTLGLYAPALKHPFVNYDDGPYVVSNPHVNSGLNWGNIKWAFTAITLGNWHPLTWISHQLDCQLFGLRAGGHHLTSVLLHLVNVLLLFFLLSKATGATGRSLLVAALFALHPLNVQSVAWVAERKNLLCTLFFLLALAAYGWYVRKPGVMRYLAVAALFVLGLASKPMVVTFPFVLLLLDFWPLARIKDWTIPSSVFPVPQAPLSRLALEKLPLFALSVASSVITVIAQQSADAMPSASAWGLSWRLENMVYGYAMYLWRAVFPQGLAPFYPVTLLSVWQVGLAVILLLAITFSVWQWRTGRHYLVSGYLWFLGTLVPVIGIIQVGAQSRADRYTYIPMIGVFVAVVWLVSDIADAKAVAMRWRVGVPVVILAVLSAVSWRELGYWRDSVDLWTHALQVTPSNIIAEENLGATLGDLGQEDAALIHYQNAVSINPIEPNALMNLGTNLMRRRRLKEASGIFETIIRTSKDPQWLGPAYRGLGAVSDMSGDRAKARENFVRALQFDPNNPKDIYNLSLIEAEEGAEKLSRIVAAHPSAETYFQLGQMLEATHKLDEAQGAYEKALRLDPKLAEAQSALQGLKAADESTGR